MKPLNQFHRLNRKTDQTGKRGHWLDIWLPRISHFSQFGLFVITLGSLYFVVLPLYQKAVLDEAIARKEIELKESEKLVELSYGKIRSYAVKQFVFQVGLNCIIDTTPIVSKEQLAKESQNQRKTVLALDVAKCINDEVGNSKELKELQAGDQVNFSIEVKNIADMIEKRRVVALEQYRQLPNKARLNPALLKPPQPFSATWIESQEKLYKDLQKLHIMSKASSDALLAKDRFDAGMLAAQIDIESVYRDYSLGLLNGLRSLTWNSHK